MLSSFFLHFDILRLSKKAFNLKTDTHFSETKSLSPNFVIPNHYFTAVACFLTFNLSAVIGNIVPSKRLAFVSYPLVVCAKHY